MTGVVIVSETRVESVGGFYTRAFRMCHLAMAAELMV